MYITKPTTLNDMKLHSRQTSQLLNEILHEIHNFVSKFAILLTTM